MRYQRYFFLPCFCIITLLAGCALFPEELKQRDESEWFGEDKLQHFLISGSGAAGVAKEATHHSASECGALTFSFVITSLTGAGKEVFDEHKRNKYWSYKDMIWNMIGASVGAAAATDCF